MVYVGILAAGLGVRINRQDIPKPFLPLGEKPIVVHTLEQFLINENIQKIIIVVHESWKLYAEDVLSRIDTMGNELTIISGGVNKTISIQILTEYITSTYGVNSDDLLLTHDAVRPFVTQRLIDESISVAKQYGASSVAMATNDTIVLTKDSSTLSEIPPKHTMLAQQTPVTFNLKTLNEVFDDVLIQGISLDAETELARLYILRGHTINLVTGEYSNMKIINPYDLEVAEALLKERFK